MCSLDDFGAGFSSLGLLKEFDVDTVKLDRRFFKNIEEKKAQEVVICIVELAKRLGIHTVAEGIETKEQLMFLREAGCDLLQGYLYAKPMPIQEFEVWEDAFKKETAHHIRKIAFKKNALDKAFFFTYSKKFGKMLDKWS